MKLLVAALLALVGWVLLLVIPAHLVIFWLAGAVGEHTTQVALVALIGGGAYLVGLSSSMSQIAQTHLWEANGRIARSMAIFAAVITVAMVLSVMLAALGVEFLNAEWLVANLQLLLIYGGANVVIGCLIYFEFRAPAR